MAAAGPVALAMAAAGQLVGGIEQNNAAKAGAKVDIENSRLAVLEGEQQSMQTRRDERGLAGEMLAAMGGGGVELGSGSAGDVIAQSAYQRELEILNIRTRSMGEANNLLQAAADKRRAGKAALIAGVFGAGAMALSGVRDMRAARTARTQAERERVILRGGSPVPRMTQAGAR